MIFGGSGSLGNKLIQTFLDSNTIVNYSRDENKHWQMDLKYKSSNLSHVIGDIRSAEKVKQALVRHKPTMIIIAAALKHIDRCEFEINESVETNILGIQNVLNAVETHLDQLTALKTVCFISTDKACSPVNVYGMCKSICEGIMVEKAKYVPAVKFVCVRYGNVLNSRGSIVPILESKAADPECSVLTLTDPRMTRFVMTLEESVALIVHAMTEGESGEIVIPKLRAMKIRDLFYLFGEKYGKPIKEVGLRPGEKMAEALINPTQSYRTVERTSSATGITYHHIRPSFLKEMLHDAPFSYTSGDDQVGKEELLGYLSHINLFNMPSLGSTNLDHMLLRLQTISASAYQGTLPYPHGSFDRMFLPSVAYEAQQAVFALPEEAWDRYDNVFEQKWTLRDKHAFPPAIMRLFDDLQSDSWVSALSEVVGTPLSLDTERHYWGVHKYEKGDSLKIHVDAGVHPILHKKKLITLGVYLSRCWEEGYGCDLEIWDGDSAARDDAVLTKRYASIPPMFNRCVIFTNTDNSWHGNPSRADGTHMSNRVFLTVSYLSDTLEDFENRRSRAYFRPLPTDDEETKTTLIEASLKRASEEGVQKMYRAGKEM